MSAKEERIDLLVSEVEELRDFHIGNGKTDPVVTLFSEDFHFLKKEGKLFQVGSEYLLGTVSVREGVRKRKRYKKRPPEFAW